MEQTSAETDGIFSAAQPPSQTAALEASQLQGLTVQSPLDLRREASFVAARISMQRRPPALALALPFNQIGGAFENVERRSGADTPTLDGGPLRVIAQDIDLGLAASLEPEMLAWRVIDLAHRLSARPDITESATAAQGLRVLGFQALMSEHLHILRTTAAEGIA